jgi:Flp pilus assembly protein TadD
MSTAPPASAPTAAQRSRVRDAAVGLLVAAAILGLAETALWAFGVRTLLSERDPYEGFSSRMRAFERDDERGVYRTVPRAVLHSFNYQEFLEKKPANGFRFFTMGGSSAYGFPWGASVAFTHVLGKALEGTFPQRRIEAINAAAMSYGSARLRILAGELLDYAPDALIVFEGHNEFIERRMRQQLERVPQLRPLQSVLFRSRVYSAMSRLYGKLRSGPRPEDKGAGAKSAGELLGLDVIRDTGVAVDDRDRAEARRAFTENLRAIAETARAKGTLLVLCTVPCNLSGWAPDQSVFPAGMGLDARRDVLRRLAEARRLLQGGNAPAAAAVLEGARSAAPGYAEVHFLLGKAYEALGKWDEARASYALARDRDAMPSRVLSSFNDTIREVGRERGVLLVDVERSFEEASPHGLVGFNLIEDYVHPTPEGHRRVALELYRALVEGGLLGEKRATDPSAFERAAGPPASVDAKSPALLFNLGVVMENKGLVDAAAENYRACIALDPRHPRAHYNLGRLLHRQGRFAEAEAEHRLAADLDPGFVMSWVGLGEALRARGRNEEACRALERATQVDPGSVYAWNGLGAALASSRRYGEAEAAFRKAIELEPGRPDARANLGFALLSQGRLADAEAAFRAALQSRPDHLASRNGLAAALVERGDLDGAERLFRETLAVAPNDPYALAGLREIAGRRGTERGVSGTRKSG